MTEKTAHEIRCDMLFEQHRMDMARIEQSLKSHVIKSDKKCEQHSGDINTIRATMNERERAGGSAKDTAVKVGVAIFGIFMTFAVGGLINKIQYIEKNISDHATVNETRWGEHETLIENRDTVQCKDIQSAQIAINNLPNQANKIAIIDCGAGAGQ